MDGMTFLGFIVIVGVGLAVPAVALELLSPWRQTPEKKTDTARVPAAALPAESMVASIPTFFAKPQSGELSAAPLGLENAMIALLQDHVKAERAVIDEFVHFPSVDNLYARPSLIMH